MSRRLFAFATLLGATIALTSSAASAAPGMSPTKDADRTYSTKVILAGSTVHHDVNGTPEDLTNPDDIVAIENKLFVAFQNGVGSHGEPSSTGDTASTLVELNHKGAAIRQWDITGKIDGLGADQATGLIAATVNEDGNSSLYTVNPSAPAPKAVTHYAYNENPLPHGGGTDAVTFMDGLMLISASAPSTADGPAVFAAFLRRPSSSAKLGLAMLSPLFADNAAATPANSTAPSQLALTDPDSNIAVPSSSPRFGGDFMLDSQGDEEQIYVSNPGSSTQALSVLQLSQSVNDTVFVTADSGALFVTDPTNDSVDTVSGPYRIGEALVAATPCGANSAPAICPGPGFPANYLGNLDLTNGTVNQITLSGTSLAPEGMVFVRQGPGGRPR